uniref:H repeat-associated protein N-terminal domain-containing protein n=1 Tax=mine drainage metagenome TaxID=410659 RepID=E6QHJ9_9ZZZZ
MVTGQILGWGCVLSNQEPLEQFFVCWEGLENPRSGNAGLPDFHELLVIALCAVLCGGQGAVDMALFARAKESFLREFLVLENGLPSHDTFSRLFRNLDPEQFRACFQQFMAEFSVQCDRQVAHSHNLPLRCASNISQRMPKEMSVCPIHRGFIAMSGPRSRAVHSDSISTTLSGRSHSG